MEGQGQRDTGMNFHGPRAPAKNTATPHRSSTNIDQRDCPRSHCKHAVSLSRTSSINPYFPILGSSETTSCPSHPISPTLVSAAHDPSITPFTLSSAHAVTRLSLTSTAVRPPTASSSFACPASAAAALFAAAPPDSSAAAAAGAPATLFSADGPTRPCFLAKTLVGS